MEDSKSPPVWIGQYVAPINARLSSVFGRGDSALTRAANDALSGGKRVRAVLSLLWCEVVSDDFRAGVPIAVAYELAHAAALILDDIIDQSDSRRGERSIVNKYGLRSAILASNVLLSRVPVEIATYSSLDSGGRTLRELFELLGNSYESTVAGEFLDLELAKKHTVGEKEYEAMVRMKTGALLAASSASGVLVGKSQDDRVKRAAYDFGEWLGMAYQVQDDILDIVGDERTLGKPAFADIRSGKKNVVLIHTIERCQEPDRRFLGSLPGKMNLEDSDINRAQSLFKTHDSIDYARRVASAYVDEARKLLESIKTVAARDRLLELLEYASERNY